MADLQPKDMQAKQKKDQESAKRVRLIGNQWKEFAKTEAYKEFIDYIELQDYFAVLSAKGPIETFDGNDGTQVKFDRENASALLQRSVGYDIVRTYVEGYTNSEAL